MERDLDEVLASQEKMLARLGRSAGPREAMKQSFQTHLERLQTWLPTRAEFAVLRVDYNRLVRDPPTEVDRLVAFLARPVDRERMLAAIDPALYRNRTAGGGGGPA
jgi:hypothetical protein